MPRVNRTIEPGGKGMTYNRTEGFTVYEHSTYSRGSVLAGQPKRIWLDIFDTLAEARAAYPQATVIEGCTYQPPSLSHLPDDDNY